jgi:hypothetical protein
MQTLGRHNEFSCCLADIKVLQEYLSSQHVMYCVYSEIYYFKSRRKLDGDRKYEKLVVKSIDVLASFTFTQDIFEVL